MKNDYEIERKFLIKMPDINSLDVNMQASILQIYLVGGEGSPQRRIRKIAFPDSVKYTYTEKLFLSDVVRREMEYEIDEAEFLRLKLQAKPDCEPIIKKRYKFLYKDQQFELDVYPFSDELAILELELENERQSIDFPDYINIIKEVTGCSEYSNASLANAGCFPKNA